MQEIAWETPLLIGVGDMFIDVIPEGTIDILHTAAFFKDDLSEEQQ